MIELLIIGLGNPILGDDGAGPRAVAALEREGGLPEGARVLDGGTAGLALLPEIEDAEAVIFVDAVDLGRAAGDLVRLEGAALLAPVRPAITAHEIGVHDLLALCALRGTTPRRTVLWGVQVGCLAATGELTPEVAAALPRLAASVRRDAGLVRGAA